MSSNAVPRTLACIFFCTMVKSSCSDGLIGVARVIHRAVSRLPGRLRVALHQISVTAIRGLYQLVWADFLLRTKTAESTAS